MSSTTGRERPDTDRVERAARVAEALRDHVRADVPSYAHHLSVGQMLDTAVGSCIDFFDSHPEALEVAQATHFETNPQLRLPATEAAGSAYGEIAARLAGAAFDRGLLRQDSDPDDVTELIAVLLPQLVFAVFAPSTPDGGSWDRAAAAEGVARLIEVVDEALSPEGGR